MKHYVEGWSQPKMWMTRVRLDPAPPGQFANYDQINEINMWCADCCKSRYWKGTIQNPIWAFDDDEDFTAFILRWVK